MPRTVDARDGSPVWRRAETAAYVESAERAVVLDLDHLDLPPYVFEGTAARIWELLDGRRTLPEVATRLADDYGAPVERVSADVGAFVERLAGLGLLVRSVAVGCDGRG